MHTNYYISRFCALSLTVFLLGISEAADNLPATSKAEVFALLPRGIDMDLAAMQRFEKLLSYGEASHPFLAEIAKETDDRTILGAILAVLEQTGAGKSTARSIAHEILIRFRDQKGNDAEAIRQRSVHALGKIGTIEDVPKLLLLLESDEELLRINAVRSLGKLGNETTVVQIKEALRRVSERPDLGAPEKQRVLAERDAALRAIQNRQPKAPASGQKQN